MGQEPEAVAFSRRALVDLEIPLQDGSLIVVTLPTKIRPRSFVVYHTAQIGSYADSK